MTEYLIRHRQEERQPTLRRETTISPEDAATRERLVTQMRRMPDGAFTRVQNVQGEVGCAHGCAFCSQGAGGDITQFTARDVRNLIAATKVVATEVADRNGQREKAEKYGLLGFDREEHKPGVIFPYFDNDPFSYLHFDELVGGLHEDLGNKVRLSTVGYSRKNEDLQAMHERVARDYTEAFDGIRFSFSRYPRGWNDPEEYKADSANTLRTYKPVVEFLGAGKEKAAAELRYAPNVSIEKGPLDDTIINDRHVIRSGQYLLVSSEPLSELEETKVVGIDGRTAITSNEGALYHVFVSDTHIRHGDWHSFAEHVTDSLPEKATDRFTPMTGFEDSVLTKQSNVFLFSNADGPYYAADPSFQEDGAFHALQLYPQTETRKVSGYLDTTRYFLNTLLEYKRDHGVGRRESLPDAQWEHVDEVLRKLTTIQEELAPYDRSTANYIENQVTRLVQSYREVLERADYEPEFFFNRFTVDTGTIVNQGRARPQFKGLASQNDMPLTPQEERGYGDATSIAAGRGRIWRWSPAPYTEKGERDKVSLTGTKNTVADRGVMIARELDYHTLTEFTPEGEQLGIQKIEGFELNKISGSEAKTIFVSVTK